MVKVPVRVALAMETAEMARVEKALEAETETEGAVLVVRKDDRRRAR
jgi:hypothetical protein